MERRHFDRVNFHAEAQLHQAEHTWPTEVRDLSLKGALLQRPEGFDAHSEQPIDLQINVEGLKIPITLRVSVCREDGDNLGVRCEVMDIDSATELRRIISVNLGDDETVKENLKALFLH